MLSSPKEVRHSVHGLGTASSFCGGVHFLCAFLRPGDGFVDALTILRWNSCTELCYPCSLRRRILRGHQRSEVEFISSKIFKRFPAEEFGKIRPQFTEWKDHVCKIVTAYSILEQHREKAP
jgi:hypothetical protein